MLEVGRGESNMFKACLMVEGGIYELEVGRSHGEGKVVSGGMSSWGVI